MKQRIGVLTSSRADFGIYLPLLEHLRNKPEVELHIVAFGSHLSAQHGFTVKEIEERGFAHIHRLETMSNSDTAEGITTSMGLCMIRFAAFWKAWKAAGDDLVFALGDRYEMFSAVAAALPHQIRFAHIHGGETTYGAIDEAFRHSISLMSRHHFCSTEFYAERIREICGREADVHVVGSLSLEGLKNFTRLDREGLYKRFGIEQRPFILATLHPETIQVDRNEQFAKVFMQVVKTISAQGLQVVITMPNADTAGSVLREVIEREAPTTTGLLLVESMGRDGYFSAMDHCLFVLGNSSSGIIEAASFGKWVINLGDRQKGRARSANVIDLPFAHDPIMAAVNTILQNPEYTGGNIYDKGGATTRILNEVLD